MKKIANSSWYTTHVSFLAVYIVVKFSQYICMFYLKKAHSRIAKLKDTTCSACSCNSHVHAPFVA